MKTPRIFFVSLLAAVLFAGGFRLWRQQQEIDRWKKQVVVAAQELSHRATERDDLEKQAREAREEATVLRGELKQAQEEQKSLAGKNGSRKNDGVLAEASRVSAETLKQWLTDADDSAVLRRLNLEARNKTIQRYSGLVAQLALTPEQTDQFTKLLTDKRQAPMDVAVTSYQRGEDPTTDMAGYRDQIAATRDGIEEQIKTLLGEDKYAQYQDYNLSSGQSNVLNNFQLALRDSSAPLNPDQAALFTEVLQNSNANKITTKVINDSREFLTPVQLQALQDLRAVQQANAQKRIQPIQVLPNAQPVAAPKPNE
jgi:hypothetical protein